MQGSVIDGLFTGAGLGLAAGGWKSCKRFALWGMLAYGIAWVVGEIIFRVWFSGDWIWSTGYPATAGNFVFVISVCILGIIAGGILGWFWGKERANESVRPLAVTASS
jgi:hypothetical protein